ncbi:MAG: peptide deformylase [Geothrix sp.]|nr:peptide deformylase [Geothrix sp.]
MTDRVLLLGDPRLRVVCETVQDVADPDFRRENERLKAALDAFRAKRGFGRGIAAPQIGIPRRFIALNLGAGTHSLINPAITWRSPETFTLWDDCMCFPELLVKVRRHRSISITFLDEGGQPRTREQVGPAESELLQHELDHLDGVLATDLALDARSIIYRAAFDDAPAHFQSQVDYVIQGTIS